MQEVKEKMTLLEFMDSYYKPSRYHERSKRHQEAQVRDNKEWLDSLGYAMISKHDSINGRNIKIAKEMIIDEE